MKKVLNNIIIILFLLVSINTTCIADENNKISTALCIDDRIDEIIDNVLGNKPREGDILNYIEAAVCINQIAGLSDNSIEHPLYPSANDMDITLWSSRDVYRRYFIGDYLNTMGFATVFPPIPRTISDDMDSQHLEELFYLSWYCDMVDKCTVRNALELAVNCLVSEYDDYIETAQEKGLCGGISNYDELITVPELKELIKKMYLLQAELYYSSDLDNGVFNTAARSSENINYYERYRRRLTFNKSMITINGCNVSVMQNEFGARLVGLRDLCNAYGIPIEWDNGKIKISYNDQQYDLRLDNFPDTTKMLVDKSIYAWHPVARDENFVDLDKSFTCFGQYEMVNDSVYLYPKTFADFISYVGIETAVTYEDLVNKDNDLTVIEKDLERMSDREQIEIILSEHTIKFVRPSGNPVYVNIYE